MGTRDAQQVHPLGVRSGDEKASFQMIDACTGHGPPKLTARSALKIGLLSQKEMNHLPTIDFLGLRYFQGG